MCAGCRRGRAGGCEGIDFCALRFVSSGFGGVEMQAEKQIRLSPAREGRTIGQFNKAVAGARGAIASRVGEHTHKIIAAFGMGAADGHHTDGAKKCGRCALWHHLRQGPEHDIDHPTHGLKISPARCWVLS